MMENLTLNMTMSVIMSMSVIIIMILLPPYHVILRCCYGMLASHVVIMCYHQTQFTVLATEEHGREQNAQCYIVVEVVGDEIRSDETIIQRRVIIHAKHMEK